MKTTTFEQAPADVQQLAQRYLERGVFNWLMSGMSISWQLDALRIPHQRALVFLMRLEN